MMLYYNIMPCIAVRVPQEVHVNLQEGPPAHVLDHDLDYV